MTSNEHRIWKETIGCSIDVVSAIIARMTIDEMLEFISVISKMPDNKDKQITNLLLKIAGMKLE